MEGSVTPDTTATNNGIRQSTKKSQGKISDSEKIFSERNTGENAEFSALGTEAKGKKFSDSQQITDDTEQAQSREYLNIYDYSKSLAEQIDDYKKGIIPRNDTLLVSGTPEIWQKVGFNALPVTINQTHVDYAIGVTVPIRTTP